MSDIAKIIQAASAAKESDARIKAIADKDSIQKLVAEMLGVNTRQLHAKVEVVEDPTTNKVIMPKGWTPYKLRSYADQLIESEESIQRCHHSVPGIPADVLVGLWKVLEARYEFAKYLTDKTWFGDVPPPMVNIKIGPKQSISIPYAKISPPAWEGGYIRPVIANEDGLVVIQGEYKRKFQPEIDALLHEVDEYLKTSSIYRGKSIILNFDWKRLNQAYNPDQHSPTFEEAPNIRPEDVILNEETEAAFRASIFSRLTAYQVCKDNGIPFKHGIVLGGKYGTGKTMAGAMISKMATDNGVTFIHLKDPNYLAEALLIAKHYGPSVLFCEDIDQVAGGEDRTSDLNDILNTLDGVDTKGMEVISIFTTNHPDKLNSAFMRAGRVDSFIYMGHPDEKSAIRFLQLYARNSAGNSLLAEGIDLDACGKALANKSPSFIAGIINTAKTHAIARTGAANLVGALTTEDITKCAAFVESQIKMTEYRKPDPAKLIENAMGVVGDLLNRQSDILESCGLPE